ncbi:hypothetical protein QTP88_025619 [Uroleucon formosanum]
MSDEKLINLNLKISKLTDIYLLKKPDLISLCTSKQLKNIGTVENLRSRLSKYYKGVVELDDIEDTLTEKEKNTILTELLNNKIEINQLLAEYDLAGDSSSESNNENTETPESKLNKLKEINNELNNKANKLSTQADSILNTSQGDIKIVFKQYEKAALINNWDNNDKITFLSIFLKDTAGTFLKNLESIKAHWSWEELKNEFLKEFQPIGYAILLKTKLFVTDIENVCRQVEKNMKEEDICTYILKGLKEPTLNAISLHDNSNLGKIKENLKKFELMQFRINSRGPPGFNEYTEILNKQIMQVGKYSKDRVEELSFKINQLTNFIKKVNFKNRNDKYYDKSVRDNSRNREDKALNYDSDSEHYKYKNNGSHPNKLNYRSRESSANRNYKNTDKRNYHRVDSYDEILINKMTEGGSDRSRRGNYDDEYSKNDTKKQYIRENSRDRTPERYKGYRYEK